MHNLDSIAKGRTMLIVAHRLRTVKGCDKILVMDNGRLVESGSHQSLVDAGGIYSRLYKQQEAQK
ncbi:MAG: ABC transporter ATP-binding protein, partial [Selenomonadales bacterium]|nr:ABC transporter ATP-binding protein [Selenomonadales bacterium]